MPKREARELHIGLTPFFSDEQSLLPLRDSLFESQGTCEVFFHFPPEKERRVIRANSALRVSAASDFLARLPHLCPQVDRVWTA
jgi:hypothetical protein